MHWLSGEGLVLSANQTELRMLGYTAEEYIGQPMMNYCPDDKELVTEIFKQLGGGNTLKVPHNPWNRFIVSIGVEGKFTVTSLGQLLFPGWVGLGCNIGVLGIARFDLNRLED